jgi:hypothetical protein
VSGLCSIGNEWIAVQLIKLCSRARCSGSAWRRRAFIDKGSRIFSPSLALHALALGLHALAPGLNALALRLNALALRLNALALRLNALALGLNALALGYALLR